MKRGDINVLLVWFGVLIALVVMWAACIWGGWLVIG